MIIVATFFSKLKCGTEEYDSINSDSSWSWGNTSENNCYEHHYETIEDIHSNLECNNITVATSLLFLETSLLILRSLTGFQIYINNFERKEDKFIDLIHRSIHYQISRSELLSINNYFENTFSIIQNNSDCTDIDNLLAFLSFFIDYIYKKNDKTTNLTNLNAQYNKLALKHMFCLKISILKKKFCFKKSFEIYNFCTEQFLKNKGEKIILNYKKLNMSKYTHFLYSYEIISFPSYLFLKYSGDFNKLPLLPKNQNNAHVFSMEDKIYTLFSFVIYKNESRKFEYYNFIDDTVFLYAYALHSNDKISSELFFKELALEKDIEILLILGL